MRRCRTLLALAVLAMLAPDALADGDSALGYWKVVRERWVGPLGLADPERVSGVQIVRNGERLQWLDTWETEWWMEIAFRDGVYRQRKYLRVDEDTNWRLTGGSRKPPPAVRKEINRRRDVLALEFRPDGAGRMRGVETEWAVWWRGQKYEKTRLKNRKFTMQRVNLRARAAAWNGTGDPMREVAFETPFEIRLTPDVAFPRRTVTYFVRVGGDIWMYDEKTRYHCNAGKGGSGAFYRSCRMEIVRKGETRFSIVRGDAPSCRILAKPGEEIEIAVDDGSPWQKVATVAGPSNPYPELVAIPAPPQLEAYRWGTGVPGRDAERALELLPKWVRLDPECDDSWIVLAVHGRGAGRLGPAPLVGPADSGGTHVRYTLLHRGTFRVRESDREDDRWAAFWKAFHHRSASRPGSTVRRMDGNEVYVVAAKVAPGAPAGRHAFRIGGHEVRWSLPRSPNSAATRFVRRFDGSPDRFLPTRDVFKHDRVFVEIETAHDCRAAAIPFELARSTGDDVEVVSFRRNGKRRTTLLARRVGARLYRSEPIVENRGAPTAWRRGALYLGTAQADRLAARVVPYGWVRQGGMSIATVRTAPAEVSAFWLGAVRDASRIAKKPLPAAPDAMSPDEMWKYLNQRWTSVSSGAVGGSDEFSVELRIGHLAAMLLVRERTISSLEAIRPHVRGLQKKLLDQPSLNAPFVREMWRELGSRRGTAIGDLEVVHPRQPKFVAFHRSYDDAWLRRMFAGDARGRERWQLRCAVDAYTRYAEAQDDALRRARGILRRRSDGSYGDFDARALFELAAIGMDRVVAELEPLLVRRVADPGEPWLFRWAKDVNAVHFVSSLGLKAKEYRARGEVADQAVFAVGLALGGGTVVAQACGAEIVVALLSAGSVGLSAAQEFGIPEFVRARQEVAFALGLHEVTGPGRYISAKVREKPGWALALELAGGAVDVLGCAADAAHGLSRWSRSVSDAAVSRALAGGPLELSRLTPEMRSTSIARYAHLRRSLENAERLTRAEEMIVEQGDRLVESLSVRIPSTRTVPLPAERADRVVAVVRRRDSDYYLVHRSEIETARDASTASKTGPPTGGGGNGTSPPAKKAPGAPDEGDGFQLAPGSTWNEFDIGERLGRGGFNSVYALRGEKDRKIVLKISRWPGIDAREDYERMRHCLELIENRVPHVDMDLDLHRVEWDGAQEDVAYLLQERVEGFIDREKITPEQSVAVCELYKKIADSGLVWTDGRLDNLVVVRMGDKSVAKVVDVDLFWKWSDNFMEGPCGTQYGHLLEVYQRTGMGERIRSLGNAPLSFDSQMRVFGGEHPFPGPHFFMMKMLEKHGYIRYVPGQGWVDGWMRLEDVRKVFPGFDDPRFVNPDLDALRTGLVAPRRIDPARERSLPRRELRVAA